MTLLSTTAVSAERRAQPRIQLPPMYTLVRVRLANETQYRWTGHIHDVSLGGMLFELDHNFRPGTVLEVRGLLPGHQQLTFHARGPVTRVHYDEHAYGSLRLAMSFDAFSREQDRSDFAEYLDGCNTAMSAA